MENRSRRSFKFHERRLPLDWAKIAKLDIGAIKRTADISQLQDLLEELIYCEVHSSGLNKHADAEFVKIFRLSQLMAEYLLHEQSTARSTWEAAYEKYEKAAAELESLKQQKALLSDELSLLKHKLSSKRRQLEMQRLLHRQAPRDIRPAQGAAYTCPICEKMFTTKEYMASHAARRHQGAVINFDTAQALSVVDPGEKDKRNYTAKIEQIEQELNRDRAQLREVGTAIKDSWQHILASQRELERTKIAETQRALHEHKQWLQDTLQQLSISLKSEVQRLADDHARERADIERDLERKQRREQQFEEEAIQRIRKTLEEFDRQASAQREQMLREFSHQRDILRQSIERQRREAHREINAAYGHSDPSKAAELRRQVDTSFEQQAEQFEAEQRRADRRYRLQYQRKRKVFEDTLLDPAGSPKSPPAVGQVAPTDSLNDRGSDVDDVVRIDNDGAAAAAIDNVSPKSPNRTTTTAFMETQPLTTRAEDTAKPPPARPISRKNPLPQTSPGRNRCRPQTAIPKPSRKPPRDDTVAAFEEPESDGGADDVSKPARSPPRKVPLPGNTTYRPIPEMPFLESDFPHDRRAVESKLQQLAEQLEKEMARVGIKKGTTGIDSKLFVEKLADVDMSTTMEPAQARVAVKLQRKVDQIVQLLVRNSEDGDEDDGDRSRLTIPPNVGSPKRRRVSPPRRRVPAVAATSDNDDDDDVSAMPAKPFTEKDIDVGSDDQRSQSDDEPLKAPANGNTTGKKKSAWQGVLSFFGRGKKKPPIEAKRGSADSLKTQANTPKRASSAQSPAVMASSRPQTASNLVTAFGNSGLWGDREIRSPTAAGGADSSIRSAFNPMQTPVLTKPSVAQVTTVATSPSLTTKFGNSRKTWSSFWQPS